MKKNLIILGVLLLLLIVPFTIFLLTDSDPDPPDGTEINITYVANNSAVGHIVGELEQRIYFRETTTTQVEAVVTSFGWRFSHWSDGETDPIRVDMTYRADVTITAYFVHDMLNMPTLSISESKHSIWESYVRTSISLHGLEDDILYNASAQIRVRGANSRSYEKLSYRLRFDDRQTFLETSEDNRGNRHFVLIAVWNDYSLMRTPMGFHIMRELGVPYVTNYTFVEVYFNYVYAGVYLLVEQIRVDEARINIDDSNTGPTNSFVVASQPGRPINQYFAQGGNFGVRGPSGTFGAMRIRSEIHNQQQMDFVRETLTNAWRAIPNRAQAERHFCLDSLVNVYIAAEIMKGFDIAWNNHFWMHFDESTGLVYFTTLWDLKFGGGNHSGYGGFWESYRGLGMIANHGQRIGQYNRWFIELMRQTWFRELVQERFAEIDDVLDSIVPFLRATHAEHRTSFERNFIRWPHNNIGTNSNNTPANIVALRDHYENAIFLINWMENRIEWLRSHIGSRAFINNAGTNNTGQ